MLVGKKEPLPLPLDNNPCGLQTWGTSGWNYGVWDYWAKHISPNKNIKIYIGAPASSSAAGGGYVPLDTLSNIALSTRTSFPSFGGVMFWGKLTRLFSKIKKSRRNSHVIV